LRRGGHGVQIRAATFASVPGPCPDTAGLHRLPRVLTAAISRWQPGSANYSIRTCPWPPPHIVSLER
jgi:hypothetical protein